MQQTEALIDRIWRISDTVQRIALGVDASLSALEPGQSLLTLSPTEYLRHQWYPVEYDEDGLLLIEVPLDSHYVPGDVVDIIGPIGGTIPWIGGSSKHLLLIAHDTPPTPLLMLANEAVNQAAEVAIVLLGSAKQYPFMGLPPAVEVITDNGGGEWEEEASMLHWAHQVFCVVHPAYWQDYFTNLYHRSKLHLGNIPVNFIYGVFNMPLPCGTGACSACMVRCKTSVKLICTQGPALDLAEVYLL